MAILNDQQREVKCECGVDADHTLENGEEITFHCSDCIGEELASIFENNSSVNIVKTDDFAGGWKVTFV